MRSPLAAFAWAVVAVAVLAFVVVPIAFYNRLVTLRNRCTESWSNVDAELRRRYDLVPNLVETVKGYAAHERSALEAVTEARARAVASRGRPSEQAADERPLVAALGRLLAVAEAYPDLKASRNFLQLQEELVNTEDRIQASRRFYNGNVRDHRNATRQFPGFLFARLFRFGEIDFFEVEAVAAPAPPVVMEPGRR